MDAQIFPLADHWELTVPWSSVAQWLLPDVGVNVWEPCPWNQHSGELAIIRSRTTVIVFVLKETPSFINHLSVESFSRSLSSLLLWLSEGFLSVYVKYNQFASQWVKIKQERSCCFLYSHLRSFIFIFMCLKWKKRLALCATRRKVSKTKIPGGKNPWDTTLMKLFRYNIWQSLLIEISIGLTRILASCLIYETLLWSSSNRQCAL